ncbi:MAG TPA: amidohydrolase [Vicinamibacteria bacterium]|nr:amidohydrolase [Vicinamibacteria bacterium]
MSVLLLPVFLQTASLVLRGGTVVTVDSSERIAEAVAVEGNRITAVGTAEEIERFVGPTTRVIDLAGRALLPGFIDAHSHVEGLAESERARLPIHIPHSLKTTADILTRLRERASEIPAGSWIVGQGTYNQPMPTREELDRAVPDHPVVLRWSAHDLLLNHKAVEVAGLTDAADPTNGIGRIERTPTGEPAILRDTGIELPIPHSTFDEMRQWIPKTLRDFFLSKGVTSVYDMSSPDVAYRIYQELKDKGELPVRILISYRFTDVEPLLRIGIRTGFGDDWLRVGAIKFHQDGVWGTTAATYRPAWKGSGTTFVPENYGGVRFEQEEFDRRVTEAHRGGWQVWVHANGDRAQDMTIAAYEAAQQAYPRLDARHRIEHFAHFLVQDPERTEKRLSRMKRAGIIPSPQVAFLWRLTDDGVKEPNVKFFPMKTLLDNGFHPAGGSDTLGTQNFATDPMFSISVAVNRKTKYGTKVQPEEAIPVMDAIKMFTIWAAYGGFEEKIKGSIEPGKLADLVVFSGDPLTVPPERLTDLHADLVVLDGKVAYERSSK